jgi:hypothetical protein
MLASESPNNLGCHHTPKWNQQKHLFSSLILTNPVHVLYLQLLVWAAAALSASHLSTHCNHCSFLDLIARAQLRQKNQDRLIVSYKKNRWSKCSQCSMEGIVIWRAHLVTIKTEQSRTIAPISSLSSVVPSCWCWRVACTRSERASRCIPSMRRRYTQNRLPALSRRIDLNGSSEALWGRHLNSTLVFPLAW